MAAILLTRPEEPPNASAWLGLSELRQNYTAKQAEADGCVVLDGSNLLSGEKYWIDFVNDTKNGRAAAVRIYQSYSDQGDSYYVKELDYDGEKFVLQFYDRTGDTGEEFLSYAEYSYLIRSPYSWNNSSAGITDYYILADDPNATAEGYFNMMLSSTLIPGDDIYNHCSLIFSNIISDDYHLRSHYDIAFADIDGDGKEEKCCLGLGHTSGVFTFTLSVYKGDDLKYSNVFQTDFYYLSFVQSEDKTLRVQGKTQGELPATHLFDIAISGRDIRLTENGALIKSLEYKEP